MMIAKCLKCSAASCANTNTELVFAVDNTAISAGSSGWTYITSFMASLVDQFYVGPNAVRVAFVHYADSPTQQFPLTQYGDKNGVETAIRNTYYHGSGTANLISALQFVQSNVIVMHNAVIMIRPTSSSTTIDDQSLCLF